MLAIPAVLGAMAFAAWWLLLTERPVADPPREPVSVRVLETKLVLRRQGVRQAEIEADRVEVSADRRTTTFIGRSRMVLYFGDQPALVATGGRIVYDRSTEDVRVVGGFHLATPEGVALVARTATWDARTQVIELVGDVEATFPLRRLP
jgi:hypothetical protein